MTSAPRSLEERLSRAAEQCQALRAALDDELELRDALIVEALDGSFTFAQVAAMTGLSKARLNQVVARRGAA